MAVLYGLVSLGRVEPIIEKMVRCPKFEMNDCSIRGSNFFGKFSILGVSARFFSA